MYFLLFIAAASTPAMLSPTAAPPASAYDVPATRRTSIGGGETDLVQLLDINLQTQTAALKVVQHANLTDEMGNEIGSVACGYAGMDTWPRSGVTLALVKLGEDRTETFDIYPMATSPEDCASHETSTATLNRAKAAFAASGLDISKKPAPIVPTPDGRYTFTVNGSAIQVSAWTASEEQADDPLLGIRESGLFTTERVLYVERTDYHLAGAGQLQITFPLAWVQGDQAVFLVRTVSSDMRAGSSEQWHLTPSVSLR